MLFADVVPSVAPLSFFALALLVLTLLLVMIVALWLSIRENRRARSHVLRPIWALPPCTVCGADACDHVRRMPGRKGGDGVAVEMKLGPDGVARGELVVEHTSEIG